MHKFNSIYFLQATFAPDTYMVTKCYMPRENTIINLYMIGSFCILVWFYCTRFKFFKGISYKEK